jgi:hypothetical protein
MRQYKAIPNVWNQGYLYFFNQAFILSASQRETVPFSKARQQNLL